MPSLFTSHMIDVAAHVCTCLLIAEHDLTGQSSCHPLMLRVICALWAMLVWPMPTDPSRRSRKSGLIGGRSFKAGCQVHGVEP